MKYVVTPPRLITVKTFFYDETHVRHQLGLNLTDELRDHIGGRRLRRSYLDHEHVVYEFDQDGPIKSNSYIGHEEDELVRQIMAGQKAWGATDSACYLLSNGFAVYFPPLFLRNKARKRTKVRKLWAVDSDGRPVDSMSKAEAKRFHQDIERLTV